MLAYLMMGVVTFGVGYVGTHWVWPDPSDKAVRDLTMLEHLDEYLEVGSFDFLTELADTQDFGPDSN